MAELSVPGFYRDNRGDKGGRNNRRVLLNYIISMISIFPIFHTLPKLPTISYQKKLFTLFFTPKSAKFSLKIAQNLSKFHSFFLEKSLKFLRFFHSFFD